MSIVGPRAKEAHFTNKWLRFTLREVAHFYFARNIVGIIHLLPLSGVLGGERLSALYGIRFDEPNLEILMRHRAVLFGLLGVFMLYAVIKPSFRRAAFLAGFVSVVSFLALAWLVGGYNAEVGRVFVADIVALVCLVVGAVASRHPFLGQGDRTCGE